MALTTAQVCSSVARVGVLVAGLICSSQAFANQIIVVQPVVAGATGLATPNLSRDLLFASAIYAQASIDIEFLPTETAASLSSNLVENDTGVLPFVTSPAYVDAPELTVFYVATIDSDAANRGASTCFGTLCAVWVANSAANDTLAHEVGHILTDFLALWDPNSSDPAHSTDPTNLLASGDIRDIPSTVTDITSPASQFDRIAPVQAAAMVASEYSQSEVPEPDSASFIILGALLMLGVFRINTPRLWSDAFQQLDRKKHL